MENIEENLDEHLHEGSEPITFTCKSSPYHSPSLFASSSTSLSKETSSSTDITSLGSNFASQDNTAEGSEIKDKANEAAKGDNNGYQGSKSDNNENKSQGDLPETNSASNLSMPFPGLLSSNLAVGTYQNSSPSSSLTPSPSSSTSNLVGGRTNTVTRRMPHLHKLEKKHSSGDLHSRLKTRKLLGVGETDDGDIHRSKLSQILGHSDQLYIRMPYGLRVWQLIVAIMFTTMGVWALVFPSHLFTTSLEAASNAEFVTVPVRLYGGALLSLSIVHWMTLSSQDRDIIRMCLITSLVYFTLQFIVSMMSSLTLTSPLSIVFGSYFNVAFRLLQILGSLYFYVILTRDGRHYR